jgi:D-glycero-alpha-D-manno-heptose-7-phosphate kinase
MIVSRAPVRFSLGGGGSDLPSYSREHGGFVVSAAVDKFVFVCVARRFYDTIRLAYSETETVDSVDKIRHRIFRAALKGMGFTGGLELHSLADVPANTGLGSSSSFTVALLNGLHAFRRESVPAEQLAREACQLEIEVLREPIGKQDQYIAAYGGISAMTFHPDGRVDVERLDLRDEVLDELETKLVISTPGWSGLPRRCCAAGQRHRRERDAAIERMHRIKALGHETRRILLAGEPTPTARC